jgi:hypothetical protein
MFLGILRCYIACSMLKTNFVTSLALAFKISICDMILINLDCYLFLTI